MLIVLKHPFHEYPFIGDVPLIKTGIKAQPNTIRNIYCIIVGGEEGLCFMVFPGVESEIPSHPNVFSVIWSAIGN